jgi:colanic acid/amylovoran biosynthesis glycosyltransferase
MFDAFHGVSKAIVQESLKYGVSIEKAKVVYSGIDVQLVQSHKKSVYALGHPVSLLSVGRIHWIKGYHHALDAIHMLRRSGFDVHYTIIAGAPSEEILYQISDLGLQGNITIKDKLPQDEVFRAMQQADVLLLPSVEEGIANVVLEAMAIGLPVISSDCGGMAEVIEHRVNGLLFPARDVAKMAECVEEIIHMSVSDRIALATAAAATIKKQHGIERLGKEMEELYRSTICA